MKQRKKQPVQTRQAILAAAAAEFARNGYAGTGLGAIVERAALTKGALFHHFPNKQALAVAWISEDLKQAMDTLWTTPLAGLESLDGFGSLCRQRCMELAPGDATAALVALTAETAAVDTVLGGALAQLLENWRGAIASFIERGKAAGWIHRSIQPAVEAALLVAAFTGFSVAIQARPDDSLRRTCASALDGYLGTLRVQ